MSPLEKEKRIPKGERYIDKKPHIFDDLGSLEVNSDENELTMIDQSLKDDKNKSNEREEFLKSELNKMKKKPTPLSKDDVIKILLKQGPLYTKNMEHSNTKTIKDLDPYL